MYASRCQAQAGLANLQLDGQWLQDPQVSVAAMYCMQGNSVLHPRRANDLLCGEHLADSTLYCSDTTPLFAASRHVL
jgi:hypothetical protein